MGQVGDDERVDRAEPFKASLDAKAGEIRPVRLPIDDAGQGDGKIPGAEGGDFTKIADPEERHPPPAPGLGLGKQLLAVVSGEAEKIERLGQIFGGQAAFFRRTPGGSGNRHSGFWEFGGP